MIGEIRTYLKENVLCVDSDLKENKSAFYDGDIGEGLIENSYQIVLNNIVLNERNSHITNTVESIISIFGFGYRDEIASYDDLLDKAICIRDNIVSLVNFSGVENITNIESSGISSEQLPGDNNGFKIDINLTITQSYSRG